MPPIHRSLILVITILLSHSGDAQIPYVDSRKLLENGIELYNKGAYKASLEQYRQIDESDTNYSTAMYEEVLSLQADSSFEEAKRLALNELRTSKSNKRELLLALAATYDYLQKTDSALIIYDSMMKLFPNDNQPWFEEGIVYFRKKLYDKAAAYFQQSLLINPNHFNSHYTLGLVYSMQGRLSEALIAFEASLLMTSNADVGKRSISLINSISEETDEAISLYHTRSEQYSHPLFDELDQLVNSKLALSKDYKLKMSLNDNIFRQSQVVLEKLKYASEDTNFVMQFYVPLLADVYGKDLFEPYMLLLFSEFGYDNIDDLAKKKSKEVADIKNIVFPYFSKIQATRELNYKKREHATERYHYYPKDDVIILGASADNGKDKFVTGDAVFLRNNHTLKATGHYNDLGEKDGWWTYYFPNGLISSKIFYAKNKVADTSSYYYLNGNLKNLIISDDEGIAAKYEYDYSGWLSFYRKRITKETAEEQSFYANGHKEYTVIYEGDNFKDGSYTFYHSNRKIKKQFTISDGKISGECRIYFDNGNLRELTNYNKAVIEGPYEDYFESGQLKEKYLCVKGKANGAFEEYYEDGMLSETGIYNMGNKEEIKKYDHTGRVYGMLSLHNNVPVKIKYTDDDNHVVFDKENKDGLFDYQLFYPDGTKSVDMKISDKGVRNGLLTFYYSTGAKSEETNYKDGDLEGASVTYYGDGKIKSEGSYLKDNRDGYYKKYYNNGLLWEEGWYKEGKRQGPWKYYYVNGKIKSERYFLDDKFNGYYKEYNINGEPEDKYIYSYGFPVAQVDYDTTGSKTDSIFFGTGSGVYKFTHWQNRPGHYYLEYGTKYCNFDGPCKHTYVNGAVKEQNYFREGNKDSLSISYFPDGTKHTMGMFTKGNKVGKWEYFNELGELQCEEYFNKNGASDGKRKIFAGNALRIAYNYKNGNKDGAQTYYGENGRTAFILYFEDGDITGYTYEGKDGKMLPKIKIKNGTAKIVTFYSNGQKSGEADFEQNEVKGQLRIYYSNGQLAEERTYKNFDLDGPFKRYNADGKLIFEVTYKDDQEAGVQHFYDKNGKLVIATNYYYGVPHGATTIIDANTNKKREYYYHYGQLTGTAE